MRLLPLRQCVFWSFHAIRWQQEKYRISPLTMDLVTHRFGDVEWFTPDWPNSARWWSRHRDDCAEVLKEQLPVSSPHLNISFICIHRRLLGRGWWICPARPGEARVRKPHGDWESCFFLTAVFWWGSSRYGSNAVVLLWPESTYFALWSGNLCICVWVLFRLFFLFLS